MAVQFDADAPNTQGGPDGGDSPDASGGQPDDYNTVQWLMAWAVLGVVLFLLNKTRLGHALLYYGLVLLLVFMLVTNYRWFTNVLAPFSSLRPGLVPPEGTPQSGAGSSPGGAASDGGGAGGSF
jgi:uncharacterized membrane protein YgcG